MILEYVADRRMVRNIAIDVNSVDPRSRSDSLIDKGEQEKRLEWNEVSAVPESFNREEHQNQVQRGKRGDTPCIGEAGIIYTDSKTPEYKELNTRHDRDGYWRSTQTNSGDMICHD